MGKEYNHLYIKNENENILIIVVYVDDIIYRSDGETMS